MLVRVERKIMKHGSSGVLAIPKAYRDYYKLSPGATVTVLYDSLLLIVPKECQRMLIENADLVEQFLSHSRKVKLE
jgi:antitoxin component of MazEF toxin-antitoxin module